LKFTGSLPFPTLRAALIRILANFPSSENIVIEAFSKRIVKNKAVRPFIEGNFLT
jgi:hypothetical protein